MALTDNYGWPVPEGSDDPAVPADLLTALAAADATVKALEDRIAALESGKSNVGHSHVRADVTDFGSYAAAGHNHDGDYQKPVTISTASPTAGDGVDGDVWFKR